jgi:hypothetical protein
MAVRAKARGNRAGQFLAPKASATPWAFALTILGLFALALWGPPWGLIFRKQISEIIAHFKYFKKYKKSLPNFIFCHPLGERRYRGGTVAH